MNQGHFVFSNGASGHGHRACTNIKHRSFSGEGGFQRSTNKKWEGGGGTSEWDKRALKAGRLRELLLGLESRKQRTDRRQSHRSRTFKSSQIQSCCGLWCWPVCSTEDTLQLDREVSDRMTTNFPNRYQKVLFCDEKRNNPKKTKYLQEDWCWKYILCGRAYNSIST